MKKMVRMLFHRVVLVGAAILLQLALLVVMLVRFERYFVYFYAVCFLLSLVVVLGIINGRSNPGYKIAWLIPILLFPIFGGLFYLMFGQNHLSRRERKKMAPLREEVHQLLPAENPVLRQLEEESPEAANQARYIEKWAYAPLTKDSFSEFLPSGESKFERMKAELERAERFIFLEYFIIEPGVMWDSILEILVRKAAQGVDVRVMYDDLGSIMTLPYRYDRQLEQLGIKSCVFNPFVPVLSSRFNNRDHRKICVVDGHTGFTGGINLADEYIDAYEKHGRWKDSAILLRGPAVDNLTVMFLTVWDFTRGETEDFAPYLYEAGQGGPVSAGDGYVQTFCDSPLDDEAVGETVYLNLINKARRYVYITTPYLIIDNEMVTALCIAAKNGVDVRIITPHIADKWYVHAVTRAYYESLVECGVRIYEYTPGFIHSKTFSVDDEYGVVGTINMDYRSLYLHFECAAWLYRTRSVLQIKEEFLRTLLECQEITLDDCRNVPWPKKLGRACLRAFAPLM
ncbi:cardiolipin synthase [Bittarella massiliensis (ex Durand et al. 2017)]|uniref:Cardiolipin synthase n=1 Tax=Bittarella massiliensis (ex Durand et al. 2017) TaxID=1720313 RepID=A0AAW5KEJ7_9FIRM|nr:cardiolipin synthase [Bittarella massiliensis (ex Durand et al. 2017)]MCQ4950505.1 cardiolipin synthase [Bittarella massiliensis (ex Durand et al. 2017)]